MAVLILLFAGMILYGVKPRRPQPVDASFLDYSQTFALRGILAVEIMLGHLGGAMTHQMLLFPFRKAGILVVGVFFFLSGYGLVCSFMQKEGYLKTFFRKRIPAILIPAAAVYCLRFAVETGDQGTLAGSFIGNFFTKTNWYVWELLGFYVLFWAAFRFCRPVRAAQLITALSVVFILVCYGLGATNPWYGSTLCFPMGLWCALYKKEVVAFCEKRIVQKLLGLLVLLGVSIASFFLLPEKNIVGIVIGRNISSLVFVALAILFLSRFCIGNRCSLWLSGVSLELYLVHNIVILFYRSKMVYIANDLLYSAAVIFTSIAAAWLLHQLCTWLAALAQGRGKKRGGGSHVS